jgi:hypothetical protein
MMKVLGQNKLDKIRITQLIICFLKVMGELIKCAGRIISY